MAKQRPTLSDKVLDEYVSNILDDINNDKNPPIIHSWAETVRTATVWHIRVDTWHISIHPRAWKADIRVIIEHMLYSKGGRVEMPFLVADVNCAKNIKALVRTVRDGNAWKYTRLSA